MVVTPVGRRKRSPTRIEHRVRMREDILDAARGLISKGGFEHLTMRTLGREVGVTAATLYGYFPAKEAVLEAILNEKMEAMQTSLAGAAINLPSGTARLIAFAIGYRRFGLSGPDFYRMFIYKMPPPDWDAIAAGQDDPHSKVLGMLHSEIVAAIAAGDMYELPPGEVCQVLWAMAHGYVTLEREDCFHTQELPPDEQERRYLQHILLALRGIFMPHALEAVTTHLDRFIGLPGGSGFIAPDGDDAAHADDESHG